jgi:hypothetical protein
MFKKIRRRLQIKWRLYCLRVAAEQIRASARYFDSGLTSRDKVELRFLARTLEDVSLVDFEQDEDVHLMD